MTLENELTASGTQERDISLKDIDTQHSHLTDISRLQNPGAATDSVSDREKTDPNHPSRYRGSAAKGSAANPVGNADMVTAATDGPVSPNRCVRTLVSHSLDFETESPLVPPPLLKPWNPTKPMKVFRASCQCDIVSSLVTDRVDRWHDRNSRRWHLFVRAGRANAVRRRNVCHPANGRTRGRVNTTRIAARTISRLLP